MKKSKRILSAFLATAMTAGLLTACGASPTSSSQTASTAQSTGSSAQTAAETPAGVSGYTDDPNEQVTLTWVLYGEMLENSQKVFDEFNQKLAEYLPNTTVKFVLLDGPSYDEQTKLMVASGEAFDIMWAANWKGDSAGKLAGGAFMPIEDLMTDFATDLRTYIPESSWGAGMYQGKLYGVVSHQSIIGGGTIGTFMSEKTYDKYGSLADAAKIDKLSSWENTTSGVADVLKEIEPVLAQAKADGYNERALFGSPFYGNLRQYECLYNLSSNAMVLGMKRGDKNLQIVNLMDTQEVKDMFALAADWNQKGYMPADVASFKQIPNNQLMALVQVGNYALESKQTTTQNINLYGEDLRYLGLLCPPYQSSSTPPSGNYINAKSKYPARAMKLMDAVVRNTDLYNYLCFGDEGVDYELKDGVATLPENPTYKLRDWLIGNTDYSLSRAANKEFMAECSKIMSEAPKGPISGFSFDGSNVKTEIASVTAVFDEYFDGLQFGTYKDNWEAKYNEFLDKLKVAGIDTLVAEMQTQIDAVGAEQGVKS